MHKGKLFPVSSYWLDKLGVPLSSRLPVPEVEKKIFEDFTRSGFNSYQEYRLYTATQQEIISYNRQRSKLSVKFGFTPPSSTMLGSTYVSSVISDDEINSLLEVQ